MNKKYNAIMEEVRLSDSQKDVILQNVLAKSKTKQPSFGWWKPLGIAFVILVAVLAIPRVLEPTKETYSSAATSDQVTESVAYDAEEAMGSESAAMAYTYAVYDEPQAFETKETMVVEGISVSVNENRAYWTNNNTYYVLEANKGTTREELRAWVKEVMGEEK